MTVAAVILFKSSEDALFDAAGRPAARRMVEAAWAGGATPIVVVADDVAGAISQALAGSPAVLAEPAPGPLDAVGQVQRGIALAYGRVSETDAVLLWPGEMAWVDAETITSLIELHGVERMAVLRPQYEDRPGWPGLVPTERAEELRSMPAQSSLESILDQFGEQGPLRLFDTGDPGTVHDLSVSIDQQPRYAGPPEPARQAPEWGTAGADAPEDVPLDGPALAPYSQAADPEAD